MGTQDVENSVKVERIPKLTRKQARFCELLLQDRSHNATGAYMAVYTHITNHESAWSMASRLLRNVKVAEYMRIRTKQILAKYQITTDEIIKVTSK